MSKQLRIWLFVLLSTLLTSTSLPAEGVITMTTSKPIGSIIDLTIEANGNITIEGIKGTPSLGWRSYTLSDQTVTIRGNVTELDCSFNQLTSLDVSGCIALTTLRCWGNQLTSLDLSGCIALTMLSCYYNQLTSLNVSGCTALTELKCWNNQLTSLDLSGCTALTKLDCSNNQLTSLDVSKNTALTQLVCYSNRLTSLDVSQNTALTTLTCGSNQLTSLDVSDCTALTTLDCEGNQLTNLDVSKNTALTTLDCKKNQLTSLDVSKNTALTELHCYDNPLTSINISGCQSLKEFSWTRGKLTSLDVSGCTALTKLNCSSNQLTSLDVSSCTALTSLDCGWNQLTSLNVSGCTALTKLDCGWNQLTSLDVSSCTALTSLDCGWNQLTSLDVSGCTALTKLDCGWNQLTSLDISGCTALTELDCHENQLTSLDISGCTALTELYCYGNQINGEGMTKLVNSLPDRKGMSSGTLRVVDYSSKKKDENWCSFADVATASEKNWAVQKSNPYCSWKSYSGVGEGVITMTTSKAVGEKVELRIEANGDVVIEGVSEPKLDQYRYTLTSQTITIRGNITKLDCSFNKLTNLDVSGCTALPKLDCSYNQLTSLDVSGCTALTTLNCSKNLLREIDLSGCTSIRFLTCHENQIKASEMANLVNSLPDLQGKGMGLFRVFYDGSGEGNVCLAAHVATVQEKGWKTQFTRDYNYGPPIWYDYTGADNPLYAVTSSSTGGGSISFTGADNLNAVPYGTELTVIATPADGYKLTKLTANGQDILETKRFKVTENTVVKATFALQSYNVTTIKLGEGTFYVSGADNLEAVTPGTELTITAAPAEGYELTKLTANDKNILDTKKVVVNEDLIIRAIFSKKKTFAVTFDKVGEGTISATGATSLNAVAYGTELTIVATPATGYELTALTANGTDILATKKVVIKGDTEVKATFTKKTFAVTLTSNEHGDITIVEPVNLEAVPYGTPLTVKATGKNAQCVLTELTANGEDILATRSFVVKGATEVKATFVDHTGVETTVTQRMQLYPNPATDYVIVEGVAPASEVTLHSMTGERIYAGRADSRGVLQIDLTPYADGVYLVCVAGKNYRVVVRR